MDFTSATNLASSGELLSFRHINANGNVKFKSVTVNSDTPGGQRHRAALLTNATPTRHCTRLSIIVSIAVSWTIRGALSPPRAHSAIKRSWAFGIAHLGKKMKGVSTKSLNRILLSFVIACPL